MAIEFLSWNATRFCVPVVAVHVNADTPRSYYSCAMTFIPIDAHVLLVCENETWLRTQCWLRALRQHIYFVSYEVALQNCIFCTHHVLLDNEISFNACLMAEKYFSSLLLRVVVPSNSLSYSPRLNWLKVHETLGLVRPLQPWITVCITAYEMGGRAAEFLQILLNSVSVQDYKLWNVIVSDHSRDNAVELVCSKYPRVQHMYFKEHYGCSSPNFNNAFNFAGGLVIKPMCMDDYFVSEDTLRLYATALGNLPGPGWCALSHVIVSGNGETRWFGIPHDSETDIWRSGRNTLSGPSIVAWSDDHCPRFRPSLINLMDVCMYADLKDARGSPLLFTDKAYVAIRNWEGSVTNTVVTGSLTDEEIAYAKP